MKNIIPAFDFTKQLKNNLGFSFTRLEESYTGYNARNPHRHKYYEVLYFSRAGGIHEIDFKSYPIFSNSIHFVSPEQVHLLRREKNVVGFVLSFTDEFFLEPGGATSFTDNLGYFNNPYVVPVLQLNGADQVTECESLIEKMKNEFISNNPDKRIALQSWMKIFLIQCKRFYESGIMENSQPLVQSEITRNFKKLVEKEFRNIKTVHDFSQLLNITAGHLSDTVQKDTGKTAGEFIHDRLILEAKRLLYHSQKSIKEVAADLNFEDPSYFTKFFKSQTGTTPEQFRQAIREKYQ